MAQVCSACGATNLERDRFCRGCGQPLEVSASSVKLDTPRTEAGSARPWVAVILIGALLLCCLGIIGVALLDELMPTHPLRSLVVGTPTPAPTWTPSPTSTPTVTPIAAPTSTPTVGFNGDSFEPDDTIPQAKEIGTGADRQTHTLNPPGDRDYVYFWATEGMQYTIETGNLGDLCDTVLTLYDQEGTELASDDDGAEEALASRLTWVAEEESTLFVEVGHFSEVPEGEDTSYNIWITESEPVAFEEDEYEPDDTIAQAKQILLDVPQNHTIHVQGDHDWIYFQAEEEITYVIETSDLGTDIDTVIYLYNEDGEELAQNDDGGEESLASRITWSVDSTGILYVMIQSYSDDGASPNMHYSISVSEGAPFEADAYEPDDSRDQASEIEVGSSQSHNLHVTGDDDWISLQATAETNYVIETFNLGDRIDTIISLYDADDQELASDDDGGGEHLASRLTWTAASDGVLYVMIKDLGNDEAGPGTEYRISVREEGSALLIADEYEPDDTMAEAREIEVGDTQTHSIHVEGDHDWLSFQAAEGTTYVIETSNLGLEMDTIVFLYDQSGTEVAEDDDSGEDPRASQIAWTADQTATFYILIRDYKDNRAGLGMAYDISLRQTQPATSETRIYIAEGAYHIVAHEVNDFIVGTSERLFLDNFTVEVDASQVSGYDDNEYGLVYGYQDQENYYEVAISGDGYAGFFAKAAGDWHTIVRFRPEESVNPGNALNHLRLEVDEGRLSFYINEQLAFEDFDDRFRDGFIGFGCGPFKEPGLHCSFDNLIVRDHDGSLIWQDDFDDNSGTWSETHQR